MAFNGFTVSDRKDTKLLKAIHNQWLELGK